MLYRVVQGGRWCCTGGVPRGGVQGGSRARVVHHPGYTALPAGLDCTRGQQPLAVCQREEQLWAQTGFLDLGNSPCLASRAQSCLRSSGGISG